MPRRSAIRDSLAATVAAVGGASYAHGAIGSAGLTQVKTADLATDSAWPHLRFMVEAQATDITPARRRDDSLCTTRYVVMIAFAVRAGIAGDGAMTDLDAASDLAEDVAIALTADGGKEYSVALVAIQVAAPQNNATMIRIEADVHHELGA